jgi:hypothetical protein
MAVNNSVSEKQRNIFLYFLSCKSFCGWDEIREIKSRMDASRLFKFQEILEWKKTLAIFFELVWLLNMVVNALDVMIQVFFSHKMCFQFVAGTQSHHHEGGNCFRGDVKLGELPCGHTQNSLFFGEINTRGRPWGCKCFRRRRW